MEQPDYSKVKAIFLDAGGTLFRPFPSVGEIYSEVALCHGLTADAEKLEAVFHLTWVKHDGLASLSTGSTEKEERKWWRNLVTEVFNEFGTIENFEGFFEELYDRFARAESWRLFPDALPLLREMKKRGKILGIVSNWDSRLFGICEGLGLKPYLNFILASAVVGAAKPHPRIFEEALKQAGVGPQEALHIGDSLEDDVSGAKRVGIHSIFLDRKGNRPTEAPTISTLQFLHRLFVN